MKVSSHVINGWHKEMQDKGPFMAGLSYRGVLLPVAFLMDRGMEGNCSSKRWCRCELSLHGEEEGREGNSDNSRGQISHSPKSRMQGGGITSLCSLLLFCGIGLYRWFRWVS